MITELVGGLKKDQNLDDVIFVLSLSTLHQTNLKCLKSGPLLKKQFFWQKLVKMSFLGKMIDIERRDLKKSFEKGRFL